MNGKGSKRRDSKVPESEVRKNWDKIFNKRMNREAKKFNQSTE